MLANVPRGQFKFADTDIMMSNITGEYTENSKKKYQTYKIFIHLYEGNLKYIVHLVFSYQNFLFKSSSTTGSLDLVLPEI